MGKGKFILVLVFSLFVFTPVYFGQTKPKAKTTTKPAAKKAPAKPYSVYICTSDRDIYYHKRSTCAVFHKCSETIKNIKSPAELKKFKKKKACQRCFSQ